LHCGRYAAREPGLRLAGKPLPAPAFHHRDIFFAITLLGFYLLMVLVPEAVGVTSGQVFYVWFSVFNLFVSSTSG
jgi:hypothetical protein